ncbi:MAG: hypothetical protein AAGC56_08095 [Pseudomonadota bacterium]
MGNGLANIVAALIVAGSIIWTNGVGGNSDAQKALSGLSEERLAEMITELSTARREDIVVSCGCCGDDDLQKDASNRSF